MPPKAAKSAQKEKEKIAVDKTFGMKNKNKSKVVQKYIKSITNNVLGAPPGGKEQQQRLGCRGPALLEVDMGGVAQGRPEVWNEGPSEFRDEVGAPSAGHLGADCGECATLLNQRSRTTLAQLVGIQADLPNGPTTVDIEFGRIQVDFCRHGSDTGQVRAMYAQIRDNFDQYRPAWPGIHQIWADFDRCWADFGQFRANSARVCHIGPGFGQHRPADDRNGQEWA